MGASHCRYLRASWAWSWATDELGSFLPWIRSLMFAHPRVHWLEGVHVFFAINKKYITIFMIEPASLVSGNQTWLGHHPFYGWFVYQGFKTFFWVIFQPAMFDYEMVSFIFHFISTHTIYIYISGERVWSPQCFCWLECAQCVYSWTRTLLGGSWNVHNFCDTCTASVKRAQLLGNVHI